MLNSPPVYPPPFCQSVCVCLFICLYISSSNCPFIHFCVCQAVHLSVHPSIVYISMVPSFYLSPFQAILISYILFCWLFIQIYMWLRLHKSNIWTSGYWWHSRNWYYVSSLRDDVTTWHQCWSFNDLLLFYFCKKFST